MRAREQMYGNCSFLVIPTEIQVESQKEKCMLSDHHTSTCKWIRHTMGFRIPTLNYALWIVRQVEVRAVVG